MKVLSITPSYFPKIGGIESVVRELAVRTTNASTHVDVAHVSAEHGAFSRDELDGLGVFRVPVAGNRLVGYARGLGALARGYDLLHVHDPQLMMLSANVILQCRDIPAVLSTHGGFNHTRKFQAIKTLHQKLLMRPMLRHYRKILATSQTDAANFGRFTDNIALCENGIDWPKFQRGRVTQAPDPTKWIYWGRWSVNKRIDALIDEVALARDNGIAIDLLVCGADFDNLAGSLRAKVDALGLADAVKLHPYIADADLLLELQRRSVFVTGSEYEGFGLGILEAMAAGKIVVCRDMAPINGFVANGATGFFMDFRAGDHDLAVLRTIAGLSAERCAAISEAAQQRSHQYDWNVVAQNFSAHYARALAG